MKVVAIIQARTGSSRFPGKVLEDLCGVSVLQRVIDRTKRATHINEVWVATTAHAADDPVASIARARGVGVFRDPKADDVFGPGKNDVLRRFVGAARTAQADIVVRITADCPLISPQVINEAVHMLSPEVDFVSNSIQRTFPRGLDVEVAWADVLYRLDRLATHHQHREHVFTYVYLDHPELFRIRHLKTTPDNSDLIWCVDHPEDLERVRRLYDDEADYRTLIERARAA